MAGANEDGAVLRRLAGLAEEAAQAPTGSQLDLLATRSGKGALLQGIQAQMAILPMQAQWLRSRGEWKARRGRMYPL